MYQTLKGKALKYGDNINTDIISPPQYMELSVEKASAYAMQAVDPAFSARVESGDIFVAGHNLGSGSSRETSPLSLKYLGIAAVVAKSFARIFYRNCINIGLTAIECPETDAIFDGDVLEIDAEQGAIYNVSRAQRYSCGIIPGHIMKIIRSGGLRGLLIKQYGGK
ncbi:MAG: 3-isopropylmalate dehydratase [Oscillospiraceae bacterium]|jgi:3-isopropylmalate/(R)-2-methylmalate dehydratase small subunit|nr:3-isopropylmalate dehydratase [Oscillospiraceae bacterium]